MAETIRLSDDAHLMIGVYRSAVVLLVAGCFTQDAMERQLKRDYATGYRPDEVAQCLGALVQAGDLSHGEPVMADTMPVYFPGPKWRVPREASDG